MLSYICKVKHTIVIYFEMPKKTDILVRGQLCGKRNIPKHELQNLSGNFQPHSNSEIFS